MYNSTSCKSKYLVITILIILVAGGLQQQTKHASFDFKVRNRNLEKIVQLRNVMIELKRIIPRNSIILNPRGQHLDSNWFKNIIEEKPNRKIIAQSKVDFLLLHDGYLASLKKEGVSWHDCNNDILYKEEIEFISDLNTDRVKSRFILLKEFPQAGLKLFIKKI